MFKKRSKIFLFTTFVQCFLASMFLIFSSMNSIMSNEAKDYLTIGTLYSYTGIQTTGILLVVSSILNLVGLIYKKKELITLGTVLIIVSLLADFLGTLLIIAFGHTCDEKVLFGSIIYLMLLLIIIIIMFIAFDDQLKLLKEKKSK